MLTGIVKFAKKHLFFNVAGLIWTLPIDLNALKEKLYLSLPGREYAFSVTCRGVIQKDVTYLYVTDFLETTKKFNFDFVFGNHAI